MQCKLKTLTFYVLVLLLITSTWFSSQTPYASANTTTDRAYNLYKDLVENDKMEARILWYDLIDNLRFLDTAEKVADIVKKTSDAKINTIVLDIKERGGFVPYQSKYSPHLSESIDPTINTFPADFDLIEHVIREAKKYDIAVHLNVNTFSAGSVKRQEGPAIDNPEWQTIIYDAYQVVNINKDIGYLISAIDTETNTDQLVIYTPDNYDQTPTERVGLEVVVENDMITHLSDRVTNDDGSSDVPQNGYVISAIDDARDWIIENMSIGKIASILGENVPAVLTADNGETFVVSGFNRQRNTDELIIFTPDQYEKSPSNRWGVEVVIVDNIITEISDRNSTGAAPVDIPEDGYLISANEKARDWVLENMELGETVKLSEEYVNQMLTTVSDEVTEYPVQAYNTTRHADEIIIFTPDAYKESPSNPYGVEVVVIDGVITEIADRFTTSEPPVQVPENGYVISAHGKARDWVLENMRLGKSVNRTESDIQLKPISETNNKDSAFMNPIREDVQQFTWAVIGELIDMYDLDGITLDRARYEGIHSDFSDLSRKRFEEEVLGKQITNWPEDIFTIEFKETGKAITPGKYYKQWLTWRAGNIEAYVKKTRDFIKAKDPSIIFDTYVGGWHPLYWGEGVNWGSKNYVPTEDMREDYWWTTDDYSKTGYLEHLDFIMTGLYQDELYISESTANQLPDWHSVEGQADLTMAVTNYEAFNYGSLYLRNYVGRSERFKEAIEMVVSKTHGVMIFDLEYVEVNNWWSLLAEVFGDDAIAPHTDPQLLELDSVIQEALSFSNDDGIYTDLSYQKLQEEIDLAILDVKQADDFSEPIQALRSAIFGLEKVEETTLEVDVTPLEALIQEAENITNDDNKYTIASFDALQAAIIEAKSALETLLTEEELAEAIAALQLAIDDLVENEVEEVEDGETPTIEQPVKPGPPTDNGVKPTDQGNEGQGSKLPTTATDFFNWLLIGLSIIAVGVISFFIFGRRKNAE